MQNSDCAIFKEANNAEETTEIPSSEIPLFFLVLSGVFLFYYYFFPNSHQF